jgi:5-methylcytosine-specific restriction endonuclease McrA
MSPSDPATILQRVCGALSTGETATAAEVLRREYPFAPPDQSNERKSGYMVATRIFHRDGFIDRYSGQRLVFPGALRMLSLLLPTEFPYHPNWRMDQTHPAFWELTATLDHVVPIARGGADTEENLVTTSMLRNSAKSNWLLEDLGWKLRPVQPQEEWDGLLNWFVQTVKAAGDSQLPARVREWYGAAKAVLDNGCIPPGDDHVRGTG